MNNKNYLDLSVFHDGNIVSIIVENDNILKFGIKKENSEHVDQLLFFGTKNIKLDNFRLGNIIVDFTVYKNEDHKNIKKHLFELLDVDEHTINYLSPYLEKTMQDILNGKMLLVSLSSSYGLDGLILCKDIKSILS